MYTRIQQKENKFHFSSPTPFWGGKGVWGMIEGRGPAIRPEKHFKGVNVAGEGTKQRRERGWIISPLYTGPPHMLANSRW